MRDHDKQKLLLTEEFKVEDSPRLKPRYPAQTPKPTDKKEITILNNNSSRLMQEIASSRLSRGRSTVYKTSYVSSLSNSMTPHNLDLLHTLQVEDINSLQE